MLSFKKITLLLLLLATALSAQEKKYQGLLWEVSGNGLKKNSYLYGSMHVSDKVSYHLPDAFFTHLLAADLVANESEPSTWMDLMNLMGSGESSYRGNKLYAGFYMEPVTKDNLYPLFRSSNYTINNLLFRTSETQEEYQEDTYLDMFIYRTGRKYHKKTVGLEDTKTSLLNIMNIDTKAIKPSEENRAALQKILKNTGYEEALMNFYRDKDLDMLDSLTTLVSSGSYLKTLLYDRNAVMVHAIDSLAHTGSLFAAVGAAHLPGRRGLIELLRAKGYTVRPVKDVYTDAGKTNKERIEGYFLKPSFTRYTTPDGMVSLPVFNAPVIENLQNLQSPDLANGGYINVKRVLLKDFLAKNNKPFNRLTLDSLFYENIPGKILDKKSYTLDGYSVYDIKNITKTGNAQHYRYYISPLEVIMVSMAGEKNYVRQFENEVYSNISVKPVAAQWTAATLKKGGFTVQLPAYRAVYGDTGNAKTVQDASLYAYDPADKAGYFIEERTLTGDDQDLGDTDPELKRMQYEFYNQLGIDSTQTHRSCNPAAFTSASKIGSKAIRLKSVIKGSKYYLMGSVGATEANNSKFFNSFALVPYASKEAWRTYKDTVARYSLSIPEAANEKLDFEPNRKFADAFGDDDNGTAEAFKEKYGTRKFTLASGQQATVFYHRYHRYTTVESVDSLWADLKNYITKDNIKPSANIHYQDGDPAEEMAPLNDGPDDGYSGREDSLWDKILNRDKQKITLVNEKKEHIANGDYDTFEALAKANNSVQALKFKAVYHKGTSYIISTITDADDAGNDPAIQRLFTSFTLLADTHDAQLPNDRLQLFIEDAGSAYDSIRSSALASAYQLKIIKENRGALQQFINDFNFKAEETGTLIQLYAKLGELKDAAVIPFFEQQYKRENNNAIIQFAVLKALTEFKSEAAYKKIRELMEYDLPVSDNDYEVSSLFEQFGSDTKNSALLFPDIMQYYSIPEYHEPVAGFTARLLEENAIKPKKLKSYKKMLVTNTRLEIKRAKSRKASQESENAYDDEEPENPGSLQNYIELLYPFKNDKEVARIFPAIKALGLQEANLKLAALDIKNGNTDKESINSLLANPETLFSVQKILAAQKEAALLKNITDEQIAASALITLSRFNSRTDSLVFLEKRIVPQDKNNVSFYFYKIKNTSENAYGSTTSRLSAVAFINNGDRINPQAYKYAGTRRLADYDLLEDYKKIMIDATMNAGNKRATFGNKASGFDSGDYEEDYEEPEY